MSNFKSGSGNLDFGDGDEDDENNEAAEETPEAQAEDKKRPESTLRESQSGHAPSNQESSEKPGVSDAPAVEYPYFVRRSNVGDERDTRLEVHVRDKVANQEGEFRSELAEQLGASEIAKTDAREFALLTAFQYPERVAELMREEGFGTLD